jgi:transcriptional regulator with XRE-family HTH domain
LIGERIYAWRERHARITQAALARKVGVTRAAVSQWESGCAEPTHARLKSVVDALGITMPRFWGVVPRLSKRKVAP